MKAMVHHRYGPPSEVLHLEDVDRPTVGADEVLVRVHAAAVNWADAALTRGEPYMLRVPYGFRAPRNGVRGSDVAGTVEEVGARVSDLRPGDAVFGWCNGAFAEYVATAADHLVVMPDGIGFEAAAAIPVAGMVALQAVRDVARTQPDDRVLVNGASGGIGTFTVQIAKAFGAHVTGVCHTRNVERVRSLGADRVLDYTREDFTALDEQFDLILDIADDRTLAERRRVLARHGTLIPNSGVGGRWFASTGRILKARLLSPFVTQRLRPFVSVAKRDDLVTLRELVESGEVSPVIGRTYPLVDTPAAVELVERGHPRGKVVIVVSDTEETQG